MGSLGRMLVVAGVILALVGLALIAADRIGLPLGRLPGDVRIERDGVRIDFPIVTCLVLSVLLSLALWLWSKIG